MSGSVYDSISSDGSLPNSLLLTLSPLLYYTLQLQMDVMEGTESLLRYVQANGTSVNETQVVYLTSVILDLIGEDTVPKEFSEV